MYNIDRVVDMIATFFGKPAWIILFVLALVYLFFRANKAQKRAILVTVFACLLFFNDYVFKLFSKYNENSTFYRHLWIIPFFSIISIAVIDLVQQIRYKTIKVCIIVALIIFAASIDDINPFFYYWNIPLTKQMVESDVVVIGNELDRLQNENQRKVQIIAPESIYEPLWLYNPNLTYVISYNQSGMENLLVSPEPNLEKIMVTGCKKGMDYLIVSKDEDQHISNKDGYEPIFCTDDYVVYEFSGYQRIKQEMTSWGQVKSRTYYSEEGVPCLCDSGYCKIEYSYDKRGHRAGISYYDTEGKLCALAGGYAGIRYEYDNNDNCVKETYLDVNNQKCMLKKGYATICRSYSNGNLLASISYYDSLDKPVYIDGRAETRREYDSEKRMIRESFYDDKGNLINNRNDFYAYQTTEYEENGLAITERYYDLNGNLVINGSGYAEYYREYNNEKKLIRGTYLGVDEKPITIPDGYCGYLRTYDENGRVAMITYLDANGHEVSTTAGYSHLSRQYDESGQITQERYYLQEIPCTLSGGYSAINKEYDENGNICLEGYLDEKLHPICRSAGYAYVKRTYNEFTQLIKEEYLDEKKEPVCRNLGYSAFTREYDSLGNITEEKYIDPKGNPVLISDGYAVKRNVYDYLGRLIREEYYDRNGNLICNKSGYAIMEYGYDLFGNKIRETRLDSYGSPVTTKEGYDTIQREYNNLRLLICEKYLLNGCLKDRTDNGVALVIKEYDEKNNLIRESYFDQQENPTKCSSGYASFDRTFNDMRQIISERYYDTDGQRILIPEGYSMVCRTYDNAGNITNVLYLDTNDKPTKCEGGYAEAIREFDDKRQIIRRQFYDELGNPIMISTGFSESKTIYNDLGNIVEEGYYNTKGELCNNKNTGYAIVKRTFDREKNLTSEMYFDEEEKSVAISDGYASFDRKYDMRGRLIKESYFDSKGERIIISKGYASFEREYNPQNKLISERYLDNFGHLVKCQEGYAYLIREYNVVGELTKELYFDEDGNPVNNSKGYCGFERVYDGWNLIAEITLDTQSKDFSLADLAADGNLIEFVHVSIPGCSRKYHLLWVSDLHIVIDNDEIAEDNRQMVRDRKTLWAIRADGKQSGDCWTEDLAKQLNDANPDTILFGGDMIDLCSEATIRKLKDGFNQISVPWIYIRADHDQGTHWLTEPNAAKNAEMQASICPNDNVLIMEYDDFIILGINHSTSQLTEEGLEQAKLAFEKGKPIIIVTHVPLHSEVDSTLDEASRTVWQNQNLTWGPNTSYVPNETTQELMDLIYADDSPVVEVLAGHLHLTWDGMITENIHEHVFPQAFSQYIGLITIDGET